MHISRNSKLVKLNLFPSLKTDSTTELQARCKVLDSSMIRLRLKVKLTMIGDFKLNEMKSNQGLKQNIWGSKMKSGLNAFKLLKKCLQLRLNDTKSCLKEKLIKKWRLFRKSTIFLQQSSERKRLFRQRVLTLGISYWKKLEV